MSKFKTTMQKATRSQLLMPVMIFLLLIIINMLVGTIFLSADPILGANGKPLWINPSFFRIEPIVNTYGDTVWSGDIIRLINGASELVLLAMGMTLVTAACGGQDISVGAVGAIAGSVFVKVLSGAGAVTIPGILFAFLICCVVTMICTSFSGALVAVFKIQPMIATLILFTAGRSIAYAVNGAASPKLYDAFTLQIGGFVSGVPIQTPIFIVVLFIILFGLLFKFTNLRLYTEAVGINEKSARLNGINPVVIKLLTFVILGVCVAAAGFISSCRMQRVDHLGMLGGIEMDAILAVAIGGNALGGGKFSLTGSVIGAYTIELLTRTLLKMQVGPEAIKVYKALFIILLMAASSPVVKAHVIKLIDYLRKPSKKKMLAVKEGI